MPIYKLGLQTAVESGLEEIALAMCKGSRVEGDEAGEQRAEEGNL